MRRIEEKHHIRRLGLGIVVLAVAAIVVLSGSCSFDTKTTLCEVSGRRCKPGQICAANQDACIDIGGCGDGVLEKGEVCDDGNILDGDGCSADCKSEEVCGNGIIDWETGERCDDGNRVSGDGCSADCKLEYAML